MTFKQTTKMLMQLSAYNMKIIFANKFIWFLLAAFIFFAIFMFTAEWNGTVLNEGLMYNLLLFPCILLIFYPTVFGIQNDEDNRILEILFGIPNYKYKVWGIRLLLIYIIIFFTLIVFSYIGNYLLYPISPLGMVAQLMFPALFLGNLAFLVSTITRSGNGTAVIMIILGIAIFFLSSGYLSSSPWDVLLNPFQIERGLHPAIWETYILQNRIFLIVGSIVWFLFGLLNLQKRERFV
ncbi:MAG: hypothetical protein IJ338_05870 [Bacteroidaceae bacterium]|nr:hypothetical protein [Bacteroidaceae bacterium]